MNETIKFAVTFAPVAESVEDVAAAVTAVTEKWAEEAYTAAPDIKYPISFDAAISAAKSLPTEHQPEAVADEAVDKAVDMLLEKGVQVADNNIKQALAKAAQDEHSQ